MGPWAQLLAQSAPRRSLLLPAQRQACLSSPSTWSGDILEAGLGCLPTSGPDKTLLFELRSCPLTLATSQRPACEVRKQEAHAQPSSTSRPLVLGLGEEDGEKKNTQGGVTSLNKASLMSRAFRGHLCSQGPSRQGPRATGFYGTRGSLEGNVPWAQEYVQMIYAHREGLLHPSTELDLWSGQRDRV